MFNLNNSIIFQEFIRSRQIISQPKQLLRSVRSALIRSTNVDQSNEHDDENEKILDEESDYNYLGINLPEDYSTLHGDYVRNDHSKYREQIIKKYKPLLQPKQKHVIDVRKKFGLLNVRFDSENNPQFHGEFEKTNDLIFKTMDDVIKHIGSNNVEFKPEPIKNPSQNMKIDFVSVEKDDRTIRKSTKNDDRIQFRFAKQLSSELRKDSEEIYQNNEQQDDWITYERTKRELSNTKKEKPEPSDSEKIMAVKFEPTNKEEGIIMKPNIISGYEYLKQIRTGKREPKLVKEFDEMYRLIPKEKLDTKGYRILSNQVPDFSRLTNDEILKMLLAQILFNDEDIVALNKPYGIAIHGAFGSTNKTLSRMNSKYHQSVNLNYFLPKLAERFECTKLYTVHRLDRDTTGVLLLAKTQEKANQLNRLFKEQKIVKKYLCITKNKPDKPEGIIDIPIELGYIKLSTPSGGKKRERMILCPEPVQDIRLQRNWRTARKAITHYKIKSDNGNAALIEVTPETGVRHQIRVHLGFGLRCPILGDHKYSNLDSLSPQRLPSDILMALKIRQSKSRTIPMHLHASFIMIPELGKNGQNIFIRSPLPYHFRQNMRSLKLRLD
uniref:Pseudouridylate synthase RPUSD4, mitochondrial n=1 Tax=Dermatophagoides pteronyssinus TaxID=6956 RepID=A0A6P6YJS6_DERPT|nr:RNA pseudouridine synthase 4, mitochondrial-like [Dermatophagoides pteronyssinus]